MSFGKNLGLDKILVMKPKQMVLLLNMSFKLSFEKVISCKKNVRQFWLNSDGLIKLLTMNTMKKHIIERNTTSDNF